MRSGHAVPRTAALSDLPGLQKCSSARSAALLISAIGISGYHVIESPRVCSEMPRVKFPLARTLSERVAAKLLGDLRASRCQTQCHAGPNAASRTKRAYATRHLPQHNRSVDIRNAAGTTP